jgi:cysteine synthase
MNPGGSVKDRAGRQMILEAEKRGELRPGGLVVEATAGNTGIGLALVANARGYRTMIVIPETQSQEKKAEIWDDTGGKMDGFICAIGSGGTLAGVSNYLKEKNKNVLIGVADPHGAAMYNFFDHGEVKATDGGSITEGIGLGRVTAIVEQMKVDKAYLIPDEEAIPIIFDLLLHEGLCLGGSSGINVAGAIRLAKDLGPGHTIVTVLADYGTRYQSKLFNPEFLRSKKLPVPEWREHKPAISIPFEKN